MKRLYFQDDNKTDRILLAGIMAFGLLLRLIILQLEPVLSRDSILYILLAREWQNTDSFEALCTYFRTDVNPHTSFWIPPFTLWLLKEFTPAAVSMASTGIAMNLVLGTALIPLIYAIAHSISPQRSLALGAALLTAVHPELIELSISVQRDNLYLFLCGLVLLCILHAERRHCVWSLAGAGALLAAAILTRFEALELCVMFFLAMILLTCRRMFSFRRFVTINCIFLGALGVTFAGLIFLMGVETWVVENYLNYILAVYHKITQNLLS